jgi:hypothetical protein
MQLRSANNALEFQIQQKDEIIKELRGDSDALRKKASMGAESNSANMKLQNENVQL